MKGRERGVHGVAWRFIAVILVAAQIVACGSVLDALPGAGGSKSGSSSDLTPELSTGTLSGVAKGGLIRNATVRAYAWSGTKGELLGSAVTDGRGRYSLSLKTRSQPVLLEVSGGDYVEEVTLKNIPLNNGEALFALRNYTSGQSSTTSITYYTTLATGLAEHLVRLGMKPPDAVEEANTRLGRVIGVDVRTVEPTDILDPDSVSAPELEYGFATAALSSLTERASILNDSEPHRIFTSVRFIQAVYDDVRADGVLNGRGVNGDVVFGRIRLATPIYRHELALHILRIANNRTANRTGRGPVQMFDLARRLNDSTDPIFGGDPVIPIDGDKPNVSAITAEEFPNLPNGAVVFGGLHLRAMVITFPGAASTELLLDGKVVDIAADPENPTVTLDTLNTPIQEGRRTLRFRVTDISGAIGESPPLEVNVSNQQTAIENISIEGLLLGKNSAAPVVTADVTDPAQPQTIRYSVKSSGAATFSPLATMNLGSGETMVQPMARVDLARAMLPDGDATFKVEVTNSVGFNFAKEVPFAVDFTDPMVSIPAQIMLDTSNPNDLQGQYFDEESGMSCMPLEPADPDDSCLLYIRKAFSVTTVASDNGALDSVTLRVDGQMVGQPFIAAGTVGSATPAFTVDPTRFVPPPRGMRDGRKTVTAIVVDRAENAASEGRQVVFDTTPPTLTSAIQLTPAVGANSGFMVDGTPALVRGTFDVVAQVQDNLGFSFASLLLDGAPIVRGDVNEGTSVALAAGGFNTGDRPDGRHVLSVIATDRAGNQVASSSPSASFIYESDNTAPTLALDMFNLIDAVTCTMAGSVADDRFQSLQYSISNGATRELLSGSAGGPFTIELQTGGRRDFTLEAKDILGNVTLLNGSYELRIDVSGSGQSGPGSIRTTCTIFVEGERVFERGR